MRTTLTIDDDVAAALIRLRKTRDQSFKDLINETLRRGLGLTRPRPTKRKSFRTRPIALGACRLRGIDNVADALAIVEGESFNKK